MITSGKVVAMSYRLCDESGQELDRADAGDPLYYLHGHNNIIPGLEKELEGKKSGDQVEVVIRPEDAYGVHRPELILKVGRQQFPKEANIVPGMRFSADIGGGQHRAFAVKAVTGDEVEIDGNHPLAGQTLHFSVAIHEIRDATAEEMSHGHVHGPHGHHHHE